jgi:4'-phosphopantetheinyl transferase EntD
MRGDAVDREVVAALFPTGVEAEVAGEAGPEELSLHPEEVRSLRGAVPRRRREFAAGRACARRAIARLGIESGPLERGEGGAPVWPAGVVGSITHCAGLCAVVVSRHSVAAGLGLDAEPSRPLPVELETLIVTEEEARWVTELPAPPHAGWSMLLFSIKESVFKCLYPLTGRFLEF